MMTVNDILAYHTPFAQAVAAARPHAMTLSIARFDPQDDDYTQFELERLRIAFDGRHDQVKRLFPKASDDRRGIRVLLAVYRPTMPLPCPLDVLTLGRFVGAVGDVAVCDLLIVDDAGAWVSALDHGGLREWLYCPECGGWDPEGFASTHMALRRDDWAWAPLREAHAPTCPALHARIPTMPEATANDVRKGAEEAA